MTQQSRPQPRELCPHLAAAVLWMSKSSGMTWRGKRRFYVRAHPGLDHLVAL